MSEGKRIAGYLLDRQIGEGGMGEVWLARHELLGRPTVLKKLHRELSAIDEITERFEREARTAAAVHERNVVVVYDAFRFRNELYIAQEFVDGADLRSILDRVGRFPPRLAAHVALEVARGLAAIHAAGTIHRDLKPANLLVSREGCVKIADFGIALERSGPSLTQAGVVLGTPTYMSPEQLSGERADQRSDVFSFGALFYELLVGRPPFVEEEDTEQSSRLSRMRKERYPAPRKLRREVPRGIARILKSCLRSNPSSRPPSALELCRRLERFHATDSSELASWLWERAVFERRADETVVVLAPPALPHRRRRSRLKAALATAAILAIACLTAGAIASEDFATTLKTRAHALLDLTGLGEDPKDP